MNFEFTVYEDCFKLIYEQNVTFHFHLLRNKHNACHVNFCNSAQKDFSTYNYEYKIWH